MLATTVTTGEGAVTSTGQLGGHDVVVQLPEVPSTLKLLQLVVTSSEHGGVLSLSLTFVEASFSRTWCETEQVPVGESLVPTKSEFCEKRPPSELCVDI
jgi:hypothetical protein